MEFITNAAPLLQVFWYIALPASLIFIVQTILTFIGAGSGDADGVDTDFDGGDAPFQLFSFRNLINFLQGFGWTGISFYNSIQNAVLLIIVSLVVGCLFVLLFFVIIRQLMKLSENNSFEASKTLNMSAEVYTPIPAQKGGTGKVQVSYGGSVHELEAMTEQERIATGSQVKIVRIENNKILIVEKL